MKHLQAIVLILFCSVVITQSALAGDDISYFSSGLGDYLSAPARWDGHDWLEFGAISGSILFVSEQQDDKWKREMVSEDHPYYEKNISRIGNQWGDLTLSGPFMLGVYGYGRWNNDTTYLNASYNMVQSAAYTGVMTTLLKNLFNRDRPCEAEDESGWFMNGKTFPSGHTSLAFAVSRSYLNSLDSPSIATQALFYGLATSTAFARTYDNKHWVSDVVAGALLGIYTADFVRDQRNKKHYGNDDISYTPYVWGDGIGIKISWR
jgi:hypothetical protein